MKINVDIFEDLVAIIIVRLISKMKVILLAVQNVMNSIALLT